MMFLSKEATDKDQSLKMQVMLSLDKDDSSNSEKIWKKNNFFWDQNANFTTKRPNLENTLVYCNQGTISTLKTEDHAIYLAYVILGQIIPANNSPPDLDNYVLEENEVRLHVPLYNNEQWKWVGIYNDPGGPDEVFFFLWIWWWEIKSFVFKL